MSATSPAQSVQEPKLGPSKLARDADGTYVPARALELIPEVQPVLNLFLSGKMTEAERQCADCDPKTETLYYSLGWGLIQSIKAFMSFQNEDLRSAISTTKHTGAVASAHRRQIASLASRFAGFVSRSTTGIHWIKGMTDMERHAELAHAETILMKAVLGILYSGDWLSFIKEAINLRSATITYRNMNDFLVAADASDPSGFDKSIDQHFRSGVMFGTATNSLTLSLLPSRVSTIVELFGYKGDRTESLAMLCKIGGWTKEHDEPSVGSEEEGIRRPMADIFLLVFHLLISNYTYQGVDLSMARKVLAYNLKRFPSGVFYLFAQGRILVCQSQPDVAVESYTKMIEACQDEYRSLRHISLWELAVCTLSLDDLSSSAKYWRQLLADANWSKCVYTFALACCLLQMGGVAETEEARKLMAQVPTLTQRIAGKSIPLEKFASRKARKFVDQSYTLSLPALELSYHFLAIAHAPRRILVSRMIPDIETALEALTVFKSNPADYQGGQGYFDNLCLAHFLRGVCMRYVAYPDREAAPISTEGASIVNAKEKALESLGAVLEHADKIELEHYLVYYTHYEIGRLHACSGNIEEGRKHLELVLSGKPLVRKSGKGKYSMESALILRTHAALESLGAGNL